MAEPAFRWLVSGTTINSLGNSISPVALAFAVLSLGGSATQLGLVIAAYAAADLVSTLGGGILGDRWRRTTMMRAANLAAGLVQAIVAASLIGHWSSLWLLGAGGACIGALGSLAGPSTQAITPQTVSEGQLASAITMRRLTENIARVVGFGLAGLLVLWLAPGGALAIDAATFTAAALCFWRIQAPAVRDAAAPGRLLTEACEGLREVLGRSWLWSLIAMAFVYHLVFGGAQGVLGPVVVGEGLGAPAWGFALAAMMIGFVAGGLLSLRWRPKRILLAGEFGLMLTVFFPLALAFPYHLWVLLLGAWLHGFGLEIFSINWDLSIQQNVPADKLARVYSLDQLGSFLARPIGLAITGPLAAVVGTQRWLVAVAAVMLVCEVVPFAVRDVRRLERATLDPEDARAVVPAHSA